MTNEQCAAIINAIGAAAEFLFSNGVPAWQQKGDTTNNETAKTACITAFEAQLEAIITDLPSEP